MALTVAMFFLSCQDTYERVGEDRPALVYPQGEAENFTLTYTETEKNLQSEGESDSRVIAVLESPHTKDFENLIFPYRTFPNGVLVTYYDEKDSDNPTIVLGSQDRVDFYPGPVHLYEPGGGYRAQWEGNGL